MLDVLTAAGLRVLAAIPDPGQGIAPPGSAKLLTILRWGAWGVFGICVLGVLLSGARMAIDRQRGGGHGEHGTTLGWTLVGCVVAGSASAIVGALS